ncbi:MAG: T9SS type A sorting domain-containing protein [Phaeodactylibacter sp.]|nr:T9SS type A sorting domain-containing protein [Phaeodactylibacter sp.]
MKYSFTPLFFCLLLNAPMFGQGDTLSRSFVHDDSLRTYLLYVPAAYDGSEEWPLVVSIHGYALDAAFQMTFSDMNSVADTAHFLIAYPQGMVMDMTLPGFPPQGLGFNLGADSIFTSPSNADDVGFIEQIIDSISTDYRVAADRIYATGFSNGGMLSNILACELGDKIAAIASVGGNLPITWDCSPSRAVPTLFIHGTADVFAPYEAGIPSFLAPVPESLDFWANNNNCGVDPITTTLADLNTADSSTVELIQWQGCEAELTHFKIENGGHQWPGGVNLLPHILGNFNLDFNASSEIWNFFNRNTLTSTKAYLNPSEIDLRAYPNPASTQLAFEFELPEAAPVNITLYNPLGQPVQELTDENLPAGRQRINWQRPASLPAGLYYYRLQIGERFVARPVVLR